MISLAPALGARSPFLDPIERAILLPVVYASLFDAPIPLTRLWDQMVGASASEAQMQIALHGPSLRTFIVESEGLIWLRGRDSAEALGGFARRRAATSSLLERSRDLLDFVRGLPGVRFAGLSGGCAHDSAGDGDIDVFLITETGFLWQTLLRATLVAKVRGWRRILCLNYLVDTTAMALPWRDFYGGFELISLKPIRGAERFTELLEANAWAAPLFPNFFQSRVHGQNRPQITSTPPRGQLLEATARMIHRPYLRYRLPKGPGVELSDHAVRLHAIDHRNRLRELFQDALRNIGMEAPPWI